MRIAEILARGVGKLFEPGDNVGMFGGDVVLFADVILQIVEREAGLGLLVGTGQAVFPRLARERAVIVREMQLPRAAANGGEGAPVLRRSG